MGVLCKIIFEGVYMSKSSYIRGVFNFSGNWQESMYPLYFLCDVFFFVISDYLWFTNFVGLVCLKSPNNEIKKITNTLIDLDFSFNLFVLY